MPQLPRPPRATLIKQLKDLEVAENELMAKMVSYREANLIEFLTDLTRCRRSY